MAAVLPTPTLVEPRIDLGPLSHLAALTFSFQSDTDSRRVWPVRIYAEPDSDRPRAFHPVVAADTGFEGIACVDDTARAALLALAVYEAHGDAHALRQARRWLTFVLYMQYSDGDFANFIRNAAGRRNASGATSIKGGPWWTARALWALARAYRVTRQRLYLRAYERCTKPTIPDSKIQALLALGEIELYQARVNPQAQRNQLLERAATILSESDSYLRDHACTDTVAVWGYHQLHALASIARVLEIPALLPECRQTVDNLVEPIVTDRFYYRVGADLEGPQLPSPIPLHGQKRGLCAYCVSPIVQGLAELYRATGTKRYRRLALQAGAWFYGRNDARRGIYDPTTGRCADGMDGGRVSLNCGAESSIEAGLAEIERKTLLDETG